MSSCSVISRFLESILAPDVAERLIALRADEATEARLRELGDKFSEGLLTPEERCEYAEDVEAIDVISILQAKARRLLSQPVE